MFHPSLRLTPAHSSWLFSISPPLQHLLPAHAVPLNFLGTLSCPFQIGFRLNSPCFMSLCWQIHSWYRHIIKTAAWAKYDLSKLFFLSTPSSCYLSFPRFVSPSQCSDSSWEIGADGERRSKSDVAFGLVLRRVGGFAAASDSTY